MKNYLYFFLINILISNKVNGQELKTYSGPYTTNLFNGNATYTYYIKDGIEIRQGNFTFNRREVKNNKITAVVSVTGKYNNNLKVGLWSYNANGIINGRNTAVNSTSNYTNGLPNGQWITKMTEKIGQTFTLQANSIATFNMGTFVDQLMINFKNNDVIAKFQIQLDNKGNIISKSIRNNQNTTISNYYKGVLINQEIGLEETKRIVNEILNNDSTFDKPRTSQYVLTKKVDDVAQKVTYIVFPTTNLFGDIPGDINFASINDQKVEYNFNGLTFEEINSIDINKYRELITAADRNFEKFNFTTSKNYYEQALNYIGRDLYCSTKINQIKDFEDNLELYNEKADKAEEQNNFKDAIHYSRIICHYNEDPSFVNRLGWVLILNKQPEIALPILELEISKIKMNNEIFPFLMGNLAHAYLLTNQIEKAKQIYYNNKDMKLENKKWNEVIMEDFARFQKLGINSVFYNEIIENLNK